jgi:uncharacterized protein YggU (UPF0235/DUF167 family)
VTARAGEPWRTTLEGVVVACRLTPKGGRDAIDGVARLADGTSVLLAAKLDAPVSRVRLAAGVKNRLKLVAVGGDPEALIARLRTL